MNRFFSAPILRATARERGRTWLVLFIAVFLMLVATTRSTADAWGAEAFSGLFAGLWWQLLILLLGGGLLADEVESGHAQLVLLRPLTRAQWVGGRFLGAAAVLCAVGTLSWAVSLVAAMLRGGSGELVGRLAVLPLALLPALGWLATLTAVSAVVRGWTNAGLVVAARVGWLLLSWGVPAAMKSDQVRRAIELLTPFIGPQDIMPLARQLQNGEPLQPWGLLWDLAWIAAAWLVAVQLFRRQELARRRAGG